jgi:glutaconate CoA-transferase subunit A
LGAYPHECYGLYEADLEHIDAYARRVGAEGVPAVLAYLQDYVYGPATHEAYLALFGSARIDRQRQTAHQLTGR